MNTINSQGVFNSSANVILTNSNSTFYVFNVAAVSNNIFVQTPSFLVLPNPLLNGNSAASGYYYDDGADLCDRLYGIYNSLYDVRGANLSVKWFEKYI